MTRLWLLTLTILLGLAQGASADPMDDLRSGNMSFKEGRYEEAVQAYTKAIISGQLSAEALAVTFNNRGVAYGELGDFDRAVLDYTEALALKPDDPTSIRNLRVGYVKRGVAQANLGELDKAVADYGKAIEIDPSHFLAYLRRGQLYAERGQSQLALVDLEKVEALDAYNQQAKDLLVKVRTQMAGGTTAPAAPASPPATTATASGTVAAAPPATGGEAAQSAIPPSALTGGARQPQPAATAPTTTAEATPPAPARATTPPAQPPAATAAPAEAAPAPEQRSTASALSSAPAGDQRVRLKQAVNMRAGPGNDFERLRTLPGGTVLAVVGSKQGWYELETSEGVRGFIYQRWLEPIAQ